MRDLQCPSLAAITTSDDEGRDGDFVLFSPLGKQPTGTTPTSGKLVSIQSKSTELEPRALGQTRREELRAGSVS